VDYGTDFSILNRRPSGNGQQGGVNFGNAAAGAANGGLVVSVLEENVQVTLRALATAGKLDVLSRPYILASDNQLASILVGPGGAADPEHRGSPTRAGRSTRSSTATSASFWT
jgi:type II secretory pathway component GspD/PulD (secretin)